MSSAARKAVVEDPAPAHEDDPVWAAMRAPISPPESDEERAIIEAAGARAERITGSVSSAADAEWLDGFPEFAEDYIGKHQGAFERSPERRALYADDPEQELADLEAGTHPLLTRAR